MTGDKPIISSVSRFNQNCGHPTRSQNMFRGHELTWYSCIGHMHEMQAQNSGDYALDLFRFRNLLQRSPRILQHVVGKTACLNRV